MLCNYHTHTTYCDGNNTPEEVVVAAIEKGFYSLGFSGHAYTSYDLRYCMKDTLGYIKEINKLKKKYADKIQIYLGIEEDSAHYVNRSDFDYILGSCHYFHVGDNHYPIDSDYDCFKKCLEVFKYDITKLSEHYYSHFVDYISKRKPDIVGHFDLITKYDEIDVMRFLNNPEYIKVSEKYMEIASQNDVIFEVNTGAISRGYRTLPYPQENLLYILKKNNGKVILSSDSHSIDTLDFYFTDAEKILRDVGFDHVYELDKGMFKKRYL
jgi:histidinol-phosphatase (PHP family)